MPKTLDLILVRHAESVANTVEGIIVGRAEDSPLTPKGREQADKLSKYLKKNDLVFDAVYSSPAVRAIETARIALGYPPDDSSMLVDDRLQEMGQGDWTGRNREDIYQGAVLKEIKKLGKDFKAPNGESMNDVGTRMVNWAESLQQNNVGCVIGFTHVVAIACFISSVFNLSHAQTRELMQQIDKTSMTLLRKDETGWKLIYTGKRP